jgi:hypothetical protein
VIDKITKLLKPLAKNTYLYAFVILILMIVAARVGVVYLYTKGDSTQNKIKVLKK